MATTNENWEKIQNGLTKAKNILQGLDHDFTPAESIMLYTAVYELSAMGKPEDSKHLYTMYRAVFTDYIHSTVLPSLAKALDSDECLMTELVKAWRNHKTMVKWLSRFFKYLDCYFVVRRSLPPLYEVGMVCFRDLVYENVNNRVRDILVGLIRKEREGEVIDQPLVKSAVEMFVEMGCYEYDFELAMLSDTSAYYLRKTSNWIVEDSWSEYMMKSEECLMRERDRVARYLHCSSEPKILIKVKNEFVRQLLEKNQSGCHALLEETRQRVAKFHLHAGGRDDPMI